MYKIRNATGMNIPLTLEKGAVTLRPGQFFDLDPHCSRDWIKKNHDLNTFFRLNKILLVHDSHVVLGATPTKPVMKAATKEAAPVRPAGPVKPIIKIVPNPQIIDLSTVAEPKITPKEPEPANVSFVEVVPAAPAVEAPAVEDAPVIKILDTLVADPDPVDPVEEHLRALEEEENKHEAPYYEDDD